MKRKPRHSLRFDFSSDVLPLFEAVKANDASDVSRLLSEGVSPDIQDEWGFTPLHYAALGNKAHLINLLCDAGAHIGARTSNQHEFFPGSTPLHCTVEWDCVEAASELIRCGADLDACNTHGETPLRLAVDTSATYAIRSPTLARLFIEAGADVNAMDKAAWTIWEEASKALWLSPKTNLRARSWHC